MEPREISSLDRTVVKAKETIDGIYDFFARLTNVRREMDIEESAAFYTKDIDAFIRVSEKNSGNTFVAGQLIFQYVNAELFLLMLDLYFQTGNGKWVKQRSQTTQALKYLKPAAAQELREKKEISFEIDPPAETQKEPAPAKSAAQSTPVTIAEASVPVEAAPAAQSTPAVPSEASAVPTTAAPVAPATSPTAEEQPAPDDEHR